MVGSSGSIDYTYLRDNSHGRNIINKSINFGKHFKSEGIILIDQVASSLELVTLPIANPYLKFSLIANPFLESMLTGKCGLSWPFDQIIIQVLDDSTDPLVN